MGPSSRVNREFAGVMPGAVHGRFGRRIPPSISYVRFTPKGPITVPFGEEQDDEFLGGMMWDGRSRTLMDIGAFLDPNEQANSVTQSNASPALRQDFSIVLARKIPGRPYAALFRSVFGGNVFFGLGNPMDLVTVSTEERVFTHVMQALSAYISSVEVNPFSSKWDAVQRGRAQFTDSERRGKNLFFGEKAQCFKCHSSATEPALAGVRKTTKNRNVFTSFVFFNTGVPKSPRNPTRAVDPGMAGNSFGSEDVPKVYYNDDEFQGKFKAPTLRNTTKGPPGFVKALTHGGFFTSLDDLVLFYSERNVAVSARSDAHGRVTKKVFDLRDGPPRGFLRQFPPPETLLNVYNVTGVPPGEGDGSDEANGQIGNLRLTKQERHDLVAFIKTLDDGFTRPYPGR
jgi:cytochrome c peroxidase